MIAQKESRGMIAQMRGEDQVPIEDRMIAQTDAGATAQSGEGGERLRALIEETVLASEKLEALTEGEDMTVLHAEVAAQNEDEEKTVPMPETAALRRGEGATAQSQRRSERSQRGS